MYRRRRGLVSAGFTLIEMLLVVIIIAILAALVAPRFKGRTTQARVAAAKHQIDVFRTSLQMYELDNGQYPTTEQGLAALREEPGTSPVPTNWQGPYLDQEVPNDPWSNPYVYVCPGQYNVDGYDVSSFGPDGEEGTEDDIPNRQR